MSSCVVCREQNAQFLCSHKCHTAYCSTICAKADWNQHYTMCGDYLDTLPKEALVVVLANMSFDDVYSSALISKRFASVINTYSFRKAFALKHKGEWEYIVMYWLREEKYERVLTWIPILLDINVWDPSDDYNFAFIYVCELGWLEIVKLLLADKRVDPAARENDAITLAIRNGHFEVVKLLLSDPRVDPSADENNAIRYASSHGQIEIVKLLLADTRVDPSAKNNYALRMARVNNYTSIVNLLEDYFRRKQEREAGQEGETKRLKLGKFLF